MNINVRAVDVHWTADGDLFITDDGDMHLATYDQNEVLVGAVARRLMSSKGDWSGQPQMGTDLISMMGLPNDAETANMIKSIITSSLTSDGLLKGEQLNVRCLPLDKYSILVSLVITALQGDEPLLLAFSYDLRDNKMIPRIITT
tara:strand:+ start:5236 stop:5670 length:435 start_codon:yes stop_codon:yes gene_type:complete